MDIYLAVGLVAAAVIVGVECSPVPSFVKERRHWGVPDLVGAMLVFIGTTSSTAAVKIGVVLCSGDLRIREAQDSFDAVEGENFIILFLGAVSALVVGLITSRDGVNRLIEPPAPRGTSEPDQT